LLMPDSLHWLGITRIDKLVSMSDDKYGAITGSGPIPLGDSPTRSSPWIPGER